jgi:uncharacterized membrane protein
MILVVVAVLAFAVAHVAPALPGVKVRLKAALGRAYGPVYGVVSLVLLVLALAALRSADRPEWFDVPDWGRHANFALSLAGFVFLGIFLFRGSWRNAVKFPMAMGVVLWGLGHMLANGDAGSVVFFGGLIAAALLQALLSKPGVIEPRQGHNLLSVLAGVALYGVVAQLHQVVAGVPVVTLTP